MPEVWIELIDGPLPTGRVAEFIHGDESLGGIVTFEGVTRLETDSAHGPLVYLDYEAYASMAAAQLRRIVEAAADRWGLGRVAVLHRLGRVAPAEVSVIVSVAAGHRAEAFEACRWLIDTLKADVPIWKKDVFADGHEEWVKEEATEPRSHEATKGIAQ